MYFNFNVSRVSLSPHPSILLVCLLFPMLILVSSIAYKYLFSILVFAYSFSHIPMILYLLAEVLIANHEPYFPILLIILFSAFFKSLIGFNYQVFQ